MRDKEDGHAARLEIGEHRKQMIDFRIRQRRRRLVEHEDTAFEGERARHLHELRVGRRDVLHPLIRPDRQLKPLEELSRPRRHRPLVEPSAWPRELAPGKDVGGDSQVRKCQPFLEHHADATRERLPRPSLIERDAAEPHVAAIGPDDAGENLEEGGFAGAVLADARVRLAAGDAEADTVERPDRAERLVQIVELEISHARGHRNTIGAFIWRSRWRGGA